MRQIGNWLVEWANPGGRCVVGPCSAELSLAGLEIEWDGPLLGTVRLQAVGNCQVAAVKVCLEERSIVPRDLGETTSELAALTVGVPFFLLRPRDPRKMFFSNHSELVLGYDFPLAAGQTWERQFELHGPWGRPFASQWRVRLDLTVAVRGTASCGRQVFLRPAASFRRCAEILGEITGTSVAVWELRTAYEDSAGRPIQHLDASLLDPLMDMERYSDQLLNPERVGGVRAYLTPLGDWNRFLGRMAQGWRSGELWRDLLSFTRSSVLRLEITAFAGRLHGTVGVGGTHRSWPFDAPADDPFEIRRQFQAIVGSRR